jgi:hypothetical protein
VQFIQIIIIVIINTFTLSLLPPYNHHLHSPSLLAFHLFIANVVMCAVCAFGGKQPNHFRFVVATIELL